MGKFAWFILGLVLGAALVLIAVTMVGREPRPPEEPAASSGPLPVQAIAPTRPAVAPVPPKVKKAEPAEPLVRNREDEAQVEEDAAAAGMTTHARPAKPGASDAPASESQ
jgi:hypothetical protein